MSFVLSPGKAPHTSGSTSIFGADSLGFRRVVTGRDWEEAKTQKPCLPQGGLGKRLLGPTLIISSELFWQKFSGFRSHLEADSTLESISHTALHCSLPRPPYL